MDVTTLQTEELEHLYERLIAENEPDNVELEAAVLEELGNRGRFYCRHCEVHSNFPQCFQCGRLPNYQDIEDP